MKFKAKRGTYIKSLLTIFLIAPIILVLLLPGTILDKPIAVIAFFVPFLLFLWIYIDTSYRIEGNNLYYKSGFVRGQIAIGQIQKVVKGKTAWSGVRPATALNGLLIVFGKADEVYISPESNDTFTDELLKLNKQIQVIG